METLTKSEVEYRREELLKRMSEGEVFIHPTDTIYGLGCNALDENAVKVGTNPLQLGRFAVGDWAGDRFRQRLGAFFRA